MEPLERLRRRVRVSQELLAVVRVMKSLAAANLRDYERAAQSMQLVTETIETGFGMLVRLEPTSLAAPSGPARGAPALVVVGSDHGMIGRFNEDALGHALRGLEGAELEPPAPVVAVGQRMAAHAVASGIRVHAVIEQPSAVEGVSRRVAEILPALEGSLRASPRRPILVAHHRPKGVAACEPVMRRLLPLDADWLASLARHHLRQRRIPWLPMPPPQVAGALVRQHLLARLHGALIESLAAEHARRLATMQAAERNVSDRLDRLAALLHRRRQSATTAEILEVTAGFRVLEAETEGGAST